MCYYMSSYCFTGFGSNGVKALGEKIFLKIDMHQDLHGYVEPSGLLIDFLILKAYIQGCMNLVHSHNGCLVHSRLEQHRQKWQNQKVEADSLTGEEKWKKTNKKTT